MKTPAVPDGQDECDSCRFPTRELELTQTPLSSVEFWCCKVCRYTMASSPLLYPDQWSHESAEILRTIAFGINATMLGRIP